jgi:hypothetical protein
MTVNQERELGGYGELKPTKLSMDSLKAAFDWGMHKMHSDARDLYGTPIPESIYKDPEKGIQREMYPFEYLVLITDEDGEYGEIEERSEILANNKDDARLKVVNALGNQQKGIENRVVLVRQFS